MNAEARSSVVLERTPSDKVGTIPLTGTFRAGAARMDLTPGLGRPIFGYGPTSKEARGTFGRLFANALVLDDGHGERVALIQCDLHGGSRYLTEQVARRVAPTHGLTTARLLLSGSHTHRGPGLIYANASYDRVSGTAFVDTWDAHFDRATADSLADRIVEAIDQAVAELEPARVGQTAVLVPQANWNRSAVGLEGFQLPDDLDPDLYLERRPPRLRRADVPHIASRLNHGPFPDRRAGAQPALPMRAGPEAAGETLEGLMHRLFLGGWPARIWEILKRAWPTRRRPQTRRWWDLQLVDKHLYVLAAFRSDDTPIGAFCTFGATSSLLGGPHAVYSGDAYQEAGQWLRQREQAAGRAPFPVGIAGGTLGDANLLPVGLSVPEYRAARKNIDTCAGWVRRLGCQLGTSIGEALDTLRSEPGRLRKDLRLRIAFAEPAPAGARFVPERFAVEKTLSPHGSFGASTLRGSELGTSPLSFLIPEGKLARRRYREDPQFPKVELPPLESPPVELPVRLVTLAPEEGDPTAVVVTVPGEMSHAMGAMVRESLSRILSVDTRRVVITGPAGEFGGYFPTVWEYLAQPYEGSSTVWGRWTGEWLRAQIEGLARGDAQPPIAPKVMFRAAAMPVSPVNLATQAELDAGTAPRPHPLYGKPPQLSRGTLRSLLRRRDDRQLTIRQRLRKEPAVIEVLARWRGPRNDDRPLWDGPLVTLCCATADGWEPARIGDMAIDDQTVNALLWCEVRADHVVWLLRWQIHAPPLALLDVDPQELGLRLAPHVVTGNEILTLS